MINTIANVQVNSSLVSFIVSVAALCDITEDAERGKEGEIPGCEVGVY